MGCVPSQKGQKNEEHVVPRESADSAPTSTTEQFALERSTTPPAPTVAARTAQETDAARVVTIPPSATHAVAGSSETDADIDNELDVDDHRSHISYSKSMIVQQQCGVTCEVATSALHDANGDLADAVMSLIGQGMVDDRVIADAISS